MSCQVPGYRLDRPIGKGSTGEVWVGRAHDGTAVAAKRLDVGRSSVHAEALRAEARLLEALEVPGLLEVIEVVESVDGPVLVTPFIDGGSLRGLLDERGTLTPGQVVAVLEPLAAVVGALAEAGIVHADLKPDNVLLRTDGRPVLADVGVARTLGVPRPGWSVAATPEYVAPEVAEGRGADQASEVFSLAVVAYESLTGRRPHRGEAPAVVAAAAGAAHRHLSTWPAIPAPVAAVVERGLSPDPAHRPGDAEAFVAALARAVAPDPVALPGPMARPPEAAPLQTATHTLRFGPAPPRPPEPSGARSGGRTRRVGVGLVVGAVALVVASAGPRRPAPASDDRDPRAPAEAGGRWVVDVDGDGSHESVRRHGALLLVQPPRPDRPSDTVPEERAYRVGTSSDQLLLGDWDGDRAASPALYRPETGEVVYTRRFPSEVGEHLGAWRATRDRPGGVARVERGASGVDVVVVEKAP